MVQHWSPEVRLQYKPVGVCPFGRTFAVPEEPSDVRVEVDDQGLSGIAGYLLESVDGTLDESVVAAVAVAAADLT